MKKNISNAKEEVNGIIKKMIKDSGVKGRIRKAVERTIDNSFDMPYYNILIDSARTSFRNAILNASNRIMLKRIKSKKFLFKVDKLMSRILRESLKQESLKIKVKITMGSEIEKRLKEIADSAIRKQLLFRVEYDVRKNKIAGRRKS